MGSKEAPDALEGDVTREGTHEVHPGFRVWAVRDKELAEHFGVSRKTAYKWLGRWREEGAGGLEGRAPVAETVANRTAEDLEKWFVEQRKRHGTWGPKKLLKVLSEERPEGPCPRRSTVCAILKRHGLVRGPRRRRREGHPGKPTGDASEPNAVWGADFKGQFRTRMALLLPVHRDRSAQPLPAGL